MQIIKQQIVQLLAAHNREFSFVLPFERTNYFHFNFSSDNKELSELDVRDTPSFEKYIFDHLAAHSCAFGAGGYGEDRSCYGKSSLYDSPEGSRTVHLGCDLWTPVGTAVFAPLSGKIHSFQDNNNYGDYGPTIILEHNLEGLSFHTLYGHLSRDSLNNKVDGQAVQKGENIAKIGNNLENGNWPPHLHFQLIIDIQGKRGDYYGVTSKATQAALMDNCPDPDLILSLFPTCDEYRQATNML